MRCLSDVFEQCKDCSRKWVVMADDKFSGVTEYFCFYTEKSARECFDEIEKNGFYDNIAFKPHTAILLAPKNT